MQQAQSDAWEVYRLKLYHPDDPPRPCRPKAGLGQVMMMMMKMGHTAYASEVREVLSQTGPKAQAGPKGRQLEVCLHGFHNGQYDHDNEPKH